MNSAIKSLIKQCIGEDGYMIDTITESELLTNAEKIQSLTAAMEQDCDQYLLFLDTLYGNKGAASYDLIIVLKQFHDIYHNNPVKLDGDLGVCPALKAWFGRMSDINQQFDDKSKLEYQSFIKPLIDKNLALLIAELPGELNQSYAPTKSNAHADQSWRTKMGLPLDQLPRTSRLLQFTQTVWQGTSFFLQCVHGAVNDFHVAIHPDLNDDTYERNNNLN